MLKKILLGAVAPLAAAALAVGVQWGSASAAPTTETAVTHVYNDPDSGGGGVWATDAFNRTLTVTENASQPTPGVLYYTATVSDTGTFVTHAGADTPNQSVAGEKISHTVTGTFTGGMSYTLSAPSGDVLGAVLPANLNDNNVAPVAPYNTSDWPAQAFAAPGSVSVADGNWGWTYTSKFGETWTDSNAPGNNDGDAVADGNITGLVVKPAKPPVLSKGHAVCIAPTREDVYFVQSGAASWDHFQIVGPGAINGHEGWVNGKIGLNAGVYSGLEAHHTYDVFYTPVEGQGSEVQIPGTHTGHVTFVTDTNC